MIAGFFFLIFFTEENNNGNCGYNDVVKFLNLKKDNDKYTLTRPVKNYNTVTEVLHLMKVFGILDMVKTEQIFISYIWVFLRWKNEHISWNPKEFCGLESITIPTELLWMPDLIIEEMTEKDKATTNPFLTIYSNGNVSFRNDHVVVSTCKMNVYKFPFDSQSCNLSFKSMTHTPREINLKTLENDKVITRWSKDLIETQDEWEFLDITVNNQTSDLDRFQSMLVYTITMKRRSVLYIANFILPILFFLILDLVSFLISDSGGEKLSFKVTVLLAVTVMQLILNDILPSSSDKVPLIALYCIGVFTLMMLSLLESILVMHLIDKDSATQNNKTDGDQSLSE
ncbi:5-hydroxytryptamine receptor 3A-like [Pelmatolapia mariae]|uniref:5-hydroxytryptamine receptor 3A-like n=1 Tax=Pelmatolapia mariae TaxID=158779 RepID=UPI002FE56057